MSYRRIACLSTEAVETLYLPGAEESLRQAATARIIANWAGRT